MGSEWALLGFGAGAAALLLIGLGAAAALAAAWGKHHIEHNVRRDLRAYLDGLFQAESDDLRRYLDSEIKRLTTTTEDEGVDDADQADA